MNQTLSIIYFHDDEKNTHILLLLLIKCEMSRLCKHKIGWTTSSVAIEIQCVSDHK